MSDYQLIHELCESKVFRSKAALDKMSDRDKEQLLYATLLSTVAGAADTITSDWGRQYAGQTAAFSNFDFFRPTGTDLYVLLHWAQVSGILGSQRNKVIQVLKAINRGQASQPQIQEMLLRLERSMPRLPSRLRTARRTIAGWEGTTPASRKAAVQNLILVINSISRRSEVLPYMKQLIGGPKGHFGKSSNWKKAAAIAGAGLAGFVLGKKAYDRGHTFKFGRREAIELDTGKMLSEDRATQLSYLAQKLPEHPAVEKLISVNYLNDGISAFVRTVDGNAYEFEIRPAPHAKGHGEKRATNESIDMTDETCTRCEKGQYVETGIQDDMRGVLHCNNPECRMEIDRHAEANDQAWEYRVEEIQPKCDDCQDTGWATEKVYDDVVKVPCQYCDAERTKEV